MLIRLLILFWECYENKMICRKKLEDVATPLEEQERSQKEFIHNFANGFRIPVQPILKFSEILADRKEYYKEFTTFLK